MTTARAVHRFALNGRPACGATTGKVSMTGALVTCPKCRAADGALDRAAAMASIEAAAAQFRATR